ncbi:MAG: hypothetical protein KBA66_04560 [Leptospiraceae bacterium]|nr:hypothetical protein [Leptospiraceae bacterium]
MDFKKIKPNDVLGFLDDLVAKIPESISSLLTKMMIGILVCSILYAIYFGYQKGYGSAEQEGQQLAEDTKSLFLEDIEREYNRKRKNIRMPSSDSFLNEEIYKTPKQYESYERNKEAGNLISPDDSLQEKESPYRSNKNSGETAPLKELNDTPTQQEPVIPTENNNNETKPKRKLYLKDSFDSPLYNSESQDLNTAIDRVTNDSEFENKILKKQKSNKKGITDSNPLISDEGKTQKREKTNINPSEKKGKLIPLDGNE